MKIPYTVTKMNKIDGILLTVTGYTYRPGLNTISKNMTQDQYRDFQIYMSDILAEQIYKAIDTQRYTKFNKSKWKPLSFNYYTWKKKNHLSLHIWEATGCLKSNIKVFKKGSYIAVGFRQKDYYPNSFLKVNTVARYMEYGTNKKTGAMPARPLFRPLLTYMRKHVSDYYKQYQKEIAELNKQGKQYIYI